jgi:hypothetical protein
VWLISFYTVLSGVLLLALAFKLRSLENKEGSVGNLRSAAQGR